MHFQLFFNILLTDVEAILAIIYWRHHNVCSFSNNKYISKKVKTPLNLRSSRLRQTNHFNNYQMADDKPVRRSPVFVDDDEVGDAVGAAGRQQLLELVVAAI